MDPRSIEPWNGVRAELRRLFGLAWPVSVAYIGSVSLSTVDTMMAGRLGPETMAAVALGALWHVAVSIVAFGAARALDPVVAQAFGAGDRRGVGLGLSRGLAMGMLLALPIAALLALGGPGLRLLGQPEGLTPDAARYAWVRVLGVPALMGFVVIRQFLAALGRMREATVAVVGANLVNAFLNWVFMYGNLGSPRLGAAGCALASAIGEWFMLAAIVRLALPVLREHWPGREGMFELRPLGRLLAIGLPLGLTFALEVWAFHAAGLMMGRFGARAIAAHTAAMNLATLSFMLPNGLAAATATRVGNLVGAALPWSRTAWVAVAAGASMMALPAAAFVFFPSPLARLYTPDAEVVAIAALLLPLAGAFQLFDGTQVVCFGALRGAGDVHLPAVANVVGYWALGLPVGFWLAFRQGAGPAGVWLGLVLALAVVAAILLLRLAAVARRGASRVRLDAPGSSS
jgi:MATE family multidrug resistance protein